MKIRILTVLLAAVLACSLMPGVLSAEASDEQKVADDEYPQLLKGALNKEQFEVILAYAPASMSNNEVSPEDLENLLQNLAMDAAFFGLRYPKVEDYNALIGVEGEWGTEEYNEYGTYYYFDYPQLSTFLSVLTGGSLTQGMVSTGSAYDAIVSDDTVTVIVPDGDGGYYNTASITASVLNEDHEIVVTYEVVSKGAETQEVEMDETRTAILKRDPSGLYRIDQIGDPTAETAREDTAESSQNGTSIREIYEGYLQDVQNGQYDFSITSGILEGYEYFLIDMDNDGILDLVVCEIYNPNSGVGVGVLDWRECRVFTAVSQNGSYTGKAYNDIHGILEAYVPADGYGFYVLNDYGRGSGIGQFQRATISDDAFLISEEWTTYSAADGTWDQFQAENPPVTWYDVSDFSGLDVLSE